MRKIAVRITSGVIWRLYFGKLLNLIRFPASINKCDYRSSALGITVKVAHRDLFTVVTVNGLDVYFKRISGEIDEGWDQPSLLLHRGRNSRIS